MPQTLLTYGPVRNGKPATAKVTAVYQDNGPADGLPRLFLFSNWSERLADWRTRDSYRVEEIPAPDGRGFMLHRSVEAIAHDGPDADTFYGVLVAANHQDHTCTCRGFQAHGHCKHHDAIRNMLDAGHIDHPLCGPTDPIDMNPEQAPF